VGHVVAPLVGRYFRLQEQRREKEDRRKGRCVVQEWWDGLGGWRELHGDAAMRLCLMVISSESSVVEWRFAALTVISSCRRSGCAGSRDAEPRIIEVQFLIQKGSAISSLR
jgi:hypothetical protein